MVTVMNSTLRLKRAYTPRYNYRYLARIKRYFAKYPHVSTNAAAKALNMQRKTVKRYREKLAV